MLGLGQKSQMQVMTEFFKNRVEDTEQPGLQLSDTSIVDVPKPKIKACNVCKVQKMNHIVREYANVQKNNSSSQQRETSLIEAIKDPLLEQPITEESTSFSAQKLRQQMLNLAPREAIEQVIFDPQYGIVKREVHFGIIDYLTVS